MSLWRRVYGESPLHLLGQLVAFALAAYAFVQVTDVRSTNDLNLVLWFVLGALLHDLLFVPIYLVLDLVSRLGLQDHPLRRIRAVNHIRYPAVISGTMALATLPLLLGRGEGAYERTSGEPAPDYLSRWLLVTAIVFAISAVAYAVRLRLGARRQAAPHVDASAGV